MFDPKTLLDRGRNALQGHHPEEASDLFAQAVAEARFVQDPEPLIEALMELGQTESTLRHPASALDCYREAAAVSEVASKLEQQAEALVESAKILRSQNKKDEAAALCNRILALAAPGSQIALLPRARALRMLAHIQEETARPDELALLWQTAASLYESAGELARAAECKSQLAFLLGQ